MGSNPTISALLAACGLYCGACYHYHASFPDGKHLLEKAIAAGRDTESYTCQGCRSNRLYIHPGCADCKIRDCVETKGILHCGQCGNFPCERIIAFINDGHIHHLNIEKQVQMLNELGPTRWVFDQAHRWSCGQCRTPFSWYEDQCHKCGSAVNSINSEVT